MTNGIGFLYKNYELIKDKLIMTENICQQYFVRCFDNCRKYWLYNYLKTSAVIEQLDGSFYISSFAIFYLFEGKICKIMFMFLPNCVNYIF